MSGNEKATDAFKETSHDPPLLRLTDLKPSILHVFRRLVREHASEYESSLMLQQSPNQDKSKNFHTQNPKQIIERIYHSLKELCQPYSNLMVDFPSLDRFSSLIRSSLEFTLELRKGDGKAVGNTHSNTISGGDGHDSKPSAQNRGSANDNMQPNSPVNRSVGNASVSTNEAQREEATTGVSLQQVPPPAPSLEPNHGSTQIEAVPVRTPIETIVALLTQANAATTAGIVNTAPNILTMAQYRQAIGQAVGQAVGQAILNREALVNLGVSLMHQNELLRREVLLKLFSANAVQNATSFNNPLAVHGLNAILQSISPLAVSSPSPPPPPAPPPPLNLNSAQVQQLLLQLLTIASQQAQSIGNTTIPSATTTELNITPVEPSTFPSPASASRPSPAIGVTLPNNVAASQSTATVQVQTANGKRRRAKTGTQLSRPIQSTGTTRMKCALSGRPKTPSPPRSTKNEKPKDKQTKGHPKKRKAPKPTFLSPAKQRRKTDTTEARQKQRTPVVAAQRQRPGTPSSISSASSDGTSNSIQRQARSRSVFSSPEKARSKTVGGKQNKRTEKVPSKPPSPTPSDMPKRKQTKLSPRKAKSIPSKAKTKTVGVRQKKKAPTPKTQGKSRSPSPSSPSEEKPQSNQIQGSQRKRKQAKLPSPSSPAKAKRKETIPNAPKRTTRNDGPRSLSAKDGSEPHRKRTNPSPRSSIAREAEKQKTNNHNRPKPSPRDEDEQQQRQPDQVVSTAVTTNGMLDTRVREHFPVSVQRALARLAPFNGPGRESNGEDAFVLQNVLSSPLESPKRLSRRRSGKR